MNQTKAQGRYDGSRESVAGSINRAKIPVSAAASDTMEAGLDLKFLRNDFGDLKEIIATLVAQAR
jgi:hypothetical protein